MESDRSKLGSHLPSRWLEILVQTSVCEVFPRWQVDFSGCSCKGTCLDPFPPSFPCRATSRWCQHTPCPKSLLPLCLQLSHQASVLSTAQLFSRSPATLLLGAQQQEQKGASLLIQASLVSWACRPLALPSQTLFLVQSPPSKPHVLPSPWLGPWTCSWLRSVTH